MNITKLLTSQEKSSYLSKIMVKYSYTTDILLAQLHANYCIYKKKIVNLPFHLIYATTIL